MKYLVGQGISAEALTAKGFGVTKPIAENESEEGREKNRRVEFNIIEQDVTKKKIQIDTKTGEEKILEQEQQQIRAPEEAPAESAAPGAGSAAPAAGSAKKPAKAGGAAPKPAPTTKSEPAAPGSQ
jgi:OOP family OmpA-OmpF porin